MAENTLQQWHRNTQALNPLSSRCEDYFQDYPVGMAAAGNALPVGTDTATNIITSRSCAYYQTNIGTQTIVGPVGAATGRVISQDLTNGDGMEYNRQSPGNTDAKFIFSLGTDAAPLQGFFVEAQFTVADVTGCAELLVGFKKNTTVAAARATYTDYAFITNAAGDIKLATDLNNAGETLTDTTENVVDGAVMTFRVEVDSMRRVTYQIATSSTDTLGTPTVSMDYQFDASDTVVPVIRLLHAAVAPGLVTLNHFKCGYLG